MRDDRHRGDAVRSCRLEVTGPRDPVGSTSPPSTGSEIHLLLSRGLNSRRPRQRHTESPASQGAQDVRRKSGPLNGVNRSGEPVSVQLPMADDSTGARCAMQAWHLRGVITRTRAMFALIVNSSSESNFGPRLTEFYASSSFRGVVQCSLKRVSFLPLVLSICVPIRQYSGLLRLAKSPS